MGVFGAFKGMIYENIFRLLNEADVRYVVVGGIAVNLHGYHRATGDLDIAMSMTDRDILEFVRVAKMHGFVPRVPVAMEDFANREKREDWIHQKNMKVFTVYNPKKQMEHIDIMTEEIVDFESLFKDRVMTSYRAIPIPVASIPHLIQMKEHAGRDRDRMDIQALRKIQELKNAK